ADDVMDPRFAREAVDWLRRPTPHGAQDPPRFLYLATAAPHRPCVPPAEYRGRSGIGPRAASILMIDDIVGQVEQALAGSSRPALVIFTSDNRAPTCHPPDRALEDHVPNGELRGQKADGCAGGHRDPRSVSGACLAPGVEERRVSLPDLSPSLRAPLQRQTEAHRATGPATARDRLALDGAPDLLRPSAPSSRIVSATAFDGSLVLMGERGTACFSTGSGGFSDPVGVPTRLDGDSGQFF